MSETTAPRSDQQNFDDYLGGPKTVTVSEVKAGSTEQPVEIHLVEFPGRPFKPSKSMRRVLVAAWGTDSSVYAGRSMTLYGDPDVRFAGQAVGGIRISHLSHLDKPLTVALTVTRGKRAPFTVEPLKVAPARDWLGELADTEGDLDLIAALGKAARAAGAQPEALAVIRKAYEDAKRAATHVSGEGADRG
ncbi:hypothetical protein J2X63_003209 [Agromyces sp. 3263]|uniref:hypothetical protein n=1 Tax=Agromyces sp. 3263 TaxID=2817750 RepID=UPI0028547A80|nr:hypothetical protein [Agromyces sp. 3263]MDR6907501.1 hypothetical protein [Agromyces sp. 3263]